MTLSLSGAKRQVRLKGKNPLDSVEVRDTIARPPLSHYIMLKEADTLIMPDSCKAWHRFMSELEELRAGKDTIISIVHLGDSHIQAGHFPGRMMRLFHQHFGNAGRGWIAPFKLARTNEPNDYFIKSVVHDWVAGRCVQRIPKTPIGMGGIGVLSQSPSINLDIVIAPNNGAGYHFNEAILYRGEQSMPMLPAGADKGNICLRRADSLATEGVLADTFHITGWRDTLQLQSSRCEKGTDRLLPASSFKNLYYGFSLTNGMPGILYHAVGVNGAMYVSYTNESYVRKLALLRPSLLIISLGTNETFGLRFNRAEFAAQMNAFLTLVKREMPHTAILLTTPPECYRRVRVNKQRTFVRNENTERAAQAIREAAQKHGLVCWDLFSISGGRNSCRQWHKEHLLGRDRIHFTQRGYEEQANLLFRALMESYNQR